MIQTLSQFPLDKNGIYKQTVGNNESYRRLPIESSDAFGVHENTSRAACVISVPSSFPHPLGFYPPGT
jgi:hypothetical protein